jgi:regulatory protein
VLPADAVVRSGLLVGRTLDRETARALARELRRSRALSDAHRALRHRDVSRRRLDERLARRGAPPEARADALASLERAGLVDDARVAAARARSLAERGYGDAAIRFALEGEQLAPELVAEALADLEPERERAHRLVQDPPDPKALRRLAARGFSVETVEDIGGFANLG